MPRVPEPKSYARLMRPEERAIIESWKKDNKIVAELCFVWTRWKRWEDRPPIVAVYAGQVVGFHAVDYTKSGTLNSVELFVLKEYRRHLLSWLLIDYALREANRLGMRRMRFRCAKGQDGDKFWRGFGLLPIGECEKEYWYDLDISQVPDLAAFRRLGPTLHEVVNQDKRTLGHYRRSGINPLTPAYAAALAQ